MHLILYREVSLCEQAKPPNNSFNILVLKILCQVRQGLNISLTTHAFVRHVIPILKTSLKWVYVGHLLTFSLGNRVVSKRIRGMLDFAQLVAAPGMTLMRRIELPEGGWAAGNSVLYNNTFDKSSKNCTHSSCSVVFNRIESRKTAVFTRSSRQRTCNPPPFHSSHMHSVGGPSPLSGAATASVPFTVENENAVGGPAICILYRLPCRYISSASSGWPICARHCNSRHALEQAIIN